MPEKRGKIMLTILELFFLRREHSGKEGGFWTPFSGSTNVF
jgi:hypothetical protein